MPELPDITIYIEAIDRRVRGRRLDAIRIRSPFVLRSFEPPIEAAHGRTVAELRRIGKRIVFALEGGLFLVIHLMIAGRLHWKTRGAAMAGKIGLAAIDFPDGTLTLTEAGTKKRASIQLVHGEEALAALDRGGIDPLACAGDEFAAALRRENRTLKRGLTDPRIVSGIGNSYSDEILHRARLSPFLLTGKMSDEEVARLFEAARSVLQEWIERLRTETGDGFPEKVTAFRDEMAVHGRYRKPCPDCGTLVQRVVYAENEMNYCPRCQTEGRLLADRALSRLLKDDWPRTIEELEEGR